MEGLVIRTAYNNQNWKNKCYRPLSDPRCFKCIRGFLFINRYQPVKEDSQGYCIGENPIPLSNLTDQTIWCWEQVLCTHYLWGNPIGKWQNAKIGMPVFFVYQEPDGTYTLWGYSTIKEIHNEIEVNKQRNEYPYLIFEPFEPLPEEKRVKYLTSFELVGTERWNMPFYRYIDGERVNYLFSRMRGEVAHMDFSVVSDKKLITSKSEIPIRLNLKREIFEKLNRIAETEGREIDELIREAVAKLIRERGAI